MSFERSCRASGSQTPGCINISTYPIVLPGFVAYLILLSRSMSSNFFDTEKISLTSSNRTWPRSEFRKSSRKKPDVRQASNKLSDSSGSLDNSFWRSSRCKAAIGTSVGNGKIELLSYSDMSLKRRRRRELQLVASQDSIGLVATSARGMKKRERERSCSKSR